MFSSVGNYNWHDHIYLITFSPKLELVITNVLANFANNFISWIEVTVLDLHLPLTGWVTLSKLLIMPPFPLLFNNSRHREQQISVKRIKYLFTLTHESGAQIFLSLTYLFYYRFLTKLFCFVFEIFPYQLSFKNVYLQRNMLWYVRFDSLKPPL